jgi:hypothetical protein
MTGIAGETFVLSNSNLALVWYLVLAFCIGIGVGISFQTYCSRIYKWLKNRFS